jgi:protein TonB
MPEGGFLEQKPRSPTGLAIVIVVHAAILSALALSKMEMPGPELFKRLEVRNIPVPKDPPPIPAKPRVEPEVEPQQPTVITRPDPIVTTDKVPVFELPPRPTDFTMVDMRPPGPRDIAIQPPEPPRPLPDPVRMEARLDPRSELLPPYPPEEQRAEREGNVTIKVYIGTDGRVKRAEKVSAASEAFWRETQRHALRNWRFKPATIDGRPVESTKQMTVRFVLDS